MLRKSERRPENRIHEPAKAILREIHPELNYFLSKNLRDHVSSIIKRNVTLL